MRVPDTGTDDQLMVDPLNVTEGIVVAPVTASSVDGTHTKKGVPLCSRLFVVEPAVFIVTVVEPANRPSQSPRSTSKRP